MTNENFTAGPDAVVAGLSDAGAEINRIAREEIAPAASLIEEAFAGAARSIERSLARAARSGSFSLGRLGQSLARDLRRVAIDSLIRRPIENLLTGALTGSFAGGRAHGGRVAPGQAFLVGERGPELFTPGASGSVRPLGPAAGVTVNITLPGVSDAASFRQSETQIAAGLARALGRGQRNL